MKTGIPARATESAPLADNARSSDLSRITIAGGEWERSVWTRLGAQSAGHSNLRRLAPNRTVPRMATPAKTTVDRRGRPPRNRREDKSLRGGATRLLFGVSKANANALTVRQVDYCDYDGGNDQEPNHTGRAAAGRCPSLWLSFPELGIEPWIDPNLN